MFSWLSSSNRDKSPVREKSKSPSKERNDIVSRDPWEATLPEREEIPDPFKFIQKIDDEVTESESKNRVVPR